MPVRSDLISPDALKSLVKDLRKGFRKIKQATLPQHEAQEILALTLGHPNWHALQQRSSDRFPSRAFEEDGRDRQQALKEAFALSQMAGVKGVSITAQASLDDRLRLGLWDGLHVITLEDLTPHHANMDAYASLGDRMNRAQHLNATHPQLASALLAWEKKHHRLHHTDADGLWDVLHAGQLAHSDLAVWLAGPSYTPALFAHNPRQRALNAAVQLAGLHDADGVTVGRGPNTDGLHLSLWFCDPLRCSDHASLVAGRSDFDGTKNETSMLASLVATWNAAYADLHHHPDVGWEALDSGTLWLPLTHTYRWLSDEKRLPWRQPLWRSSAPSSYVEEATFAANAVAEDALATRMAFERVSSQGPMTLKLQFSAETPALDAEQVLNYRPLWHRPVHLLSAPAIAQRMKEWERTYGTWMEREPDTAKQVLEQIPHINFIDDGMDALPQMQKKGENP